MVACHVNGNVLALWHIEAGYIRYQWVWRIVPACQHELWRDRDVTARNRLSAIAQPSRLGAFRLAAYPSGRRSILTTLR